MCEDMMAEVDKSMQTIIGEMPDFITYANMLSFSDGMCRILTEMVLGSVDPRRTAVCVAPYKR